MAEFPRGRQRSDGLLHHLAAVLTLPVQARRGSGVGARRQRQRLAMAQRLLDPLPMGLRASAEGEGFWRLLRWGGAGMWLAWLLQR
ncbi:MAG: hypothetical protein VKM98_02780 [Cyanobacteriota bacterium]|nr:hypothetical protein [Cyanobacteriota bacterium]